MLFRSLVEGNWVSNPSSGRRGGVAAITWVARLGENKCGSLDGRDVAALPREAWFPRPARGDTMGE